MNRDVFRLIGLLAAIAAGACANERAARDPSSSTAPEGGESKEAAPEVPAEPPGRKFEPDERWGLSDPSAVKALRDTPFGEQEITEFWTRKGWHLTRREERYMAALDELIADGRITKTTHWSQTPFNAVYQATEPLRIEGMAIPANTEFWMEFCENEDDIRLGRPLFARTHGYKEEHQGHADQASDSRPGELRAGRERH